MVGFSTVSIHAVVTVQLEYIVLAVVYICTQDVCISIYMLLYAWMHHCIN